jgi:hypothetical protein
MEYIIKLSKAGKMPCASFSLPAQACKTGAKLALIPGSVCASCYALKGNYSFPNVKNVRALNLASLPDTDWTEWITSMVASISKATNNYFRWHDSGDLQNIKHYHAIIEVAKQLPNIKFWLPTKERKIVGDGLGLPKNLVVRLSSPMIDQKPLTFINTSTVRKHKKAFGFACTAPENNGKCGDCRACWNKDIKNVSYDYH